MATALDIINKQQEEEKKKYEFKHLIIGDIFELRDRHTFIKIKEASADGANKESEPDAVDLENGHYYVLGGGTICELIKPLFPENIYKRLTMSEIYKLPGEGRAMYSALRYKLNSLCRRLPQYSETEIMLALLRYFN